MNDQAPGEVLWTGTVTVAGRLDAILTALLQADPPPDRAISRVMVAEWISQGLVTRNHRVLSKPSVRVQPGEKLLIRIPPPPVIALTPEVQEFEVVHADEEVLVVSKPVGLRVHPVPQDLPGSLVAGILGRGLTLAPAGGALRPGVVHRLDKTTSGLMVLARTDFAYHALVAQFKARTITKVYRALTLGFLPGLAGTCEAAIGRDPRHRKRFAVTGDGKPARSDYRVLQRGPLGDLVELQLHTGRTHQLRVHLQHLGAPVLGDGIYGGHLSPQRIVTEARLAGSGEATVRASYQRVASLLRAYPGNCLHAYRLAFDQPVTGARLDYTVPPPAVWSAIQEACAEVEPWRYPQS